MDLPAVCQKLDEVAVGFFEILEELTERKTRFQEDLRDGFFSLSKARYSMGSRSVGSLQYPTNMKTLASVQVSDSNGSCTFCAERRNPGKTAEVQEGNDQIASLERSSDNQVRKRKTNKEVDDDSSSLEDRIQDVSLDDDHTAVYQDPIKWFGILVPAALRQGQKSFIQAVDQSVEIASLQNRLTALQHEFQELMKLKKKLRANKESETDEQGVSEECREQT